MATRNPAWLNANETRSYPLADSADLRSVQGDRLPHDIITDINLRYPNDLGLYPYLAAVGVTDQLVSLTIQAATSLSDTSSLSPVAALGLSKPIIEGRPYALESQYPGSGGWVVFGSGVQENFSGRFLGPARSLLSPRAARSYRTLPVSSLSKLNALTALTGLVRLSGTAPIEVVKESRTIQGVNRDVVVVRLTQPAEDAVIDGENSIFREFLGKCSGRPESLTCGDPAPIEFINTVRPDCNGNITIEFDGCAKLAEVLDNYGVLVDCELGLIDACALGTLAASDGKLRTEYDDECVVNAESLWFNGNDFENVPSDSISEIVVTPPPFSGSLPFYECFATGNVEQWNTISGTFALVSDVSPDPICDQDAFSDSFEGVTTEDRSYESTDLGRRNIVTWEGFDTTTMSRRLTVDFKMINAGAKKNAGVILNYRPHPTVPGRYLYHLVELDYDAGEIRVLRWNGTNFVTEPAFAAVPGISLGLWYRLQVEVTPGSEADISVQLTNVDAPALSVSFSFTAASFSPADGYFGLHANRSQSRFNSIRVEAI